MSGDLISRDTTIKMLRDYGDLKFANGEMELSSGIFKAVSYIKNDNIPPSYDVEKVIRQLEKNKEDAIKATVNVCESYQAFGMTRILKELFEEYTRQQIEIVKSGGIEEEKGERE